MEIVIRPKTKWWKLDLKEIFRLKDMFYYLTWRDVKVKYKQTFIGALWAIFQPFITMVVFSVFFGRLAQMPSDGIPYPIFVYTGLLFWTLLSSGLTRASASFVTNEKIVTKIYFPRVIMPVSAIITHVVDFVVASFILAGMMAWYGFLPSIAGLLIAPVLVSIPCLV